MAPSGWNKFEGEVGAYDVKWQDLVDPTENVKISSSPVKSTTSSISALGDVQELGKSLASKRNADLVYAKERLTDDILFYTFSFKIKDGTHQLLQLCVNKGKVWSLDASAKERRWDKRSELYENILGRYEKKVMGRGDLLRNCGESRLDHVFGDESCLLTLNVFLPFCFLAVLCQSWCKRYANCKFIEYGLDRFANILPREASHSYRNCFANSVSIDSLCLGCQVCLLKIVY